MGRVKKEVERWTEKGEGGKVVTTLNKLVSGGLCGHHACLWRSAEGGGGRGGGAGGGGRRGTGWWIVVVAVD